MPLNVSAAEKQELLTTFAALVLHDSKLPVTSDAITKLIVAAGATVEPYWPKLFGQTQRRTRFSRGVRGVHSFPFGCTCLTVFAALVCAFCLFSVPP